MAAQTLSALAEAVVDDTPVDWDGAESSAGEPAELEALRQLRLIASLGRAARSIQRHWGPFELRAELGRGAFGTVYRAWDPRVGREVALKLLRAEADADLDAGGVIAEARLLAGVEHPNVVPVYGADVHDGQVGIWTKLVDGKTLKDILREQGPFAAHEAAQVGQAICTALAAVHRRGFVHRDIKAQNVMRAVGGEILLMDFGAGDSQDVGRTTVLRGSPAYLAPEVVAGAPPTPSSDLYSVGVLLYHLVTGEFPVVGSTWADLREQHESGRHRSLVDARPDLPPWFTEAVERALSREPAKRPASAGEFRQLLDVRRGSSARTRLQTSAAVFLALGLLTLVAYWVLAPDDRRVPYSSAGTAGIPAGLGAPLRIGVLPVRNLTGDEGKGYVAAGLTELLITHLARLPGVNVPSSEATAPLAAENRPTRETADALGVTLLLAGSLVQAGGRLHLAVQLVDPALGETVWGEEVARAADSVFDAAEYVVQSVARRLHLSAGIPPGQGTQTRAQRAPEVEEAFLRGLADVNSNLDHRLPSAVAHLTRAVNADPTFAEGWAELALADQRYVELRDPAERERLAEGVKEKAQRAIQIDPLLPTAHVALGVIQFHHEWDFEGAAASFRRAIELVPGNAYARTRYAWLLAAESRLDEAIQQAETARSLEPLVAARHTTLGMIRYYARDYARALNDMNRALELSPGFPLAHLCIGRILLAAGDAHGAAEATERALASGRNPGWLWALAHAQAQAGDARALRHTQEQIELQAKAGRFASIDNAAYLAIAQGRAEEALAFLEEAVSRRMTNVLWLAVDPRLDPVREDERFVSLLAAAGLSK
jgi:TolB-like protein/Tfp pilus assembly protein PilF